MEGKLIIFSAPSGSGKTTIVHNLLKQLSNLEFSISATNRPSRNNEINGRDYYFLTTEDFKNKIKNSEFIEWEEVYQGRFYGTLKAEIERIWSKENHVIFDVDVLGGINIKKQFKQKALSIFIKPPSIDELKNRLEKRSTDTDEDIQTRLKKAELEMSYADQFDLVIVNDKLEDAVSKAIYVVNNFIELG